MNIINLIFIFFYKNRYFFLPKNLSIRMELDITDLKNMYKCCENFNF